MAGLDISKYPSAEEVEEPKGLDLSKYKSAVVVKTADPPGAGKGLELSKYPDAVEIDEPLKKLKDEDFLSKVGGYEAGSESDIPALKKKLKDFIDKHSSTPAAVIRKNHPYTYGFSSAMAHMTEGVLEPANLFLLLAAQAKIPKLASQMASGGFTVMMASQLNPIRKKFNEALQAKDGEGISRWGLTLAGQTLFTAMGLRGSGAIEAAGERFPSLKPITERLSEPTPISRIETLEEKGIRGELSKTEEQAYREEFQSKVLKTLPKKESTITDPSIPSSQLMSDFEKVMEEKFGSAKSQRGGILNPIAVLDALMTHARESKSFDEFQKKISGNKDLKDTVEAYALSLKNVYDKKNDQEVASTVSSLTEQVYAQPKVHESDVNLAYETGNEILVDNLPPSLKSPFPPQGVQDLIVKSKESIPFHEELQGMLNRLDGKNEALKIRAKQNLEPILDNMKTGDGEAMAYHIEDPKEPLTPEQQAVFDSYLRPLREDANYAFNKVKGMGIPISDDTYMRRFVRGKGGVFDRMLAAAHSIGVRTGAIRGKPNLLRVSSGMFKHRVMHNLIDENGNKVVAAVKGGNVTAFVNGKPAFFGKAPVKTYEDLMNKGLDPIRSEMRSLQKELDILTATKGRREASPIRIQNIETKLEKLNSDWDEVVQKYSPFDLNKKVMFAQGKRWTIGPATMKEVEAASPISYHKNAVLNETIRWLEIKRIENAVDFWEGLKGHPDFKARFRKFGKDVIPPDWRQPEIPNFRGAATDPHTADVLDSYYHRMIRGGSPQGIYSAINNFLRNVIFTNPFLHVPNVVDHWSVNRGAVAWADPTRAPVLLKTMAQAINGVIHQDQGYLDMLESGVNFLYHRHSGPNLYELIARGMGEELRREPVFKEKIRSALGIPIETLDKALELSARTTWFTNDVLTYQAILEEMAGGKSKEMAIQSVSNHIPDYRVPARVLGSTHISELLTNQNLTMFSRYHYGIYKSYGAMAHSLLGLVPGNKVPLGEAGEALSKMIMIGLNLFVTYPILSYLAQGLTGKSEKWQVRRSGSASFFHNSERLREGKIAVEQYIDSIVTPAVGFKLFMEGVQNKDWVTGRKILRRGHIFHDLPNLGVSIIKATAPLDVVRRISSGKLKPEDYLYGLFSFRRER